jgi:formylglycine-generating enzyme required for sulfatase activity
MNNRPPVICRGVLQYAPTVNLGAIFIAALLIILPMMLSACSRPPEGMVAVPAGEFIMGTDEQDPQEKAMEYGIMKPWFNDEHPAHRVNLPLYFIDTYEVTKADYLKFAQATGRRPPMDWQNGQYPPGKERHPIEEVAWEDANAYCLWAGKRLPTEAEWEKAARGPDGLKYPWGNEFDENRANVNNQVGNTTEVGHYENGRSPYGAYDMIGNVWEWTADWYQPYPGNTYHSDKFGMQLKVLRGNSFAGLGHFPPRIYDEVKAHYSHAGYRLFLGPNGTVNDGGFRCVKSAK